MPTSKRVPALRFKGFTDPWEQRKLGDYLTSSRILGHTGKDAKKLTVKLWGKGVVEKAEVYRGSNNTQYYIRRAGQFMYGKLDFLHAAFGIVPDKLDNYESTIDSPAFDLNGIESQFILNLATQESFYLQKGITANGSRKAKRIHEETFLSMETAIPSLSEQRQIGAFFQQLDILITLHQRKYDKLVVLKKSMLEKMFPKSGSNVPELRFAGFTDPWEQRKLGDVVSRYKDMVTTPRNGYWRLGVRSHAKGTFLTFVPEGMQLGEKKLCKVAQDVLIVNIVFAWEHAVAITNQVDVKALVSHRFPQYSFYDDMVPGFFKYAILDARFKHHLWLSSPSGAGRNKTLITGEMLKYEFVFPEKSEQERIAIFLDKLDSLITLHQRELDLLKNVKKSLLEKMFV